MNDAETPQAEARAHNVIDAVAIVFAVVAPMLWIVPLLRGRTAHLDPLAVVAATGLAIVGAAFLASWATELAERYVPAPVALIGLAFVSVLPEYSVDLWFAIRAGRDPLWEPYPLANMTGGNRLILGVGLPLVVLLQGLRGRGFQAEVPSALRVPVAALLLATLVSFGVQVTGTLGLAHTAILLALFAIYVLRALRAEIAVGEPVGPAALLDRVRRPLFRWLLILVLFGAAGFCLVASAEPFADALVAVGRARGMEEFLLVQLVGPLASEAPELLVAALFAFRGRAEMAVGVLIVALVHQWTLLLSALPPAFALSRGSWDPLPLTERQSAELLLTSAQSLFAAALLAGPALVWIDAVALFVLFAAQWFATSPEARYFIAGLFLVFSAFVGLGSKERARSLSALVRFEG